MCKKENDDNNFKTPSDLSKIYNRDERTIRNYCNILKIKKKPVTWGFKLSPEEQELLDKYIKSLPPEPRGGRPKKKK